MQEFRQSFKFAGVVVAVCGEECDASSRASKPAGKIIVYIDFTRSFLAKIGEIRIVVDEKDETILFGITSFNMNEQLIIVRLFKPKSELRTGRNNLPNTFIKF